jgi:hypothetical protein
MAPASVSPVLRLHPIVPMKPFLVAALSLSALASAFAAEETVAPPPVAAKVPETVAVRPGEAFTFRVGWGLFGSAGEVKVFATTETLSATPQTRVVTTTRTAGVIRALYSFDGEVVAQFDATDGRLLSARAETMAGSKATKMAVDFDYAKGLANYVDALRPARNAALPMPTEARPMDLITVLIQARAWNLKIGEKHPCLVLFDNQFYPLTITALRLEKISTPKGKREAMLLEPKMEGTPKGMFKKGGSVQVWISNDADRLPLQFEVSVKVGTATATLVDYQAPGSKPADAAKAPAKKVTPPPSKFAP